MSGKGIVRLAGLVVVGALAFAVFAGRGGDLWRTEVTVVEVTSGSAVNAVSGIVRVHAERTAEIRAELGGRVLQSELEVGKAFSKGDILLVLDGGELERRLAQVRGELKAEEEILEIGSLRRYDLEQAREDLSQKEVQVEKGQASRRDLDSSRRLIERLTDEIELEKILGQRRVEMFKHEIQSLGEQLKTMVVTSSVDGLIVEVFSYPGDLVSPRATVARILSNDRIVEASVSEEDFAGVAVGQGVTVRFLGYGPRLFRGEVAKVLPSADAQTQRYTVHLDLEISSELLVPGITGEVSIVLDERAGGLIVPRRALMRDQVFVVEDGRAVLRKVEPGFTSLTRVEILSGVTVGEKVIVENVHELRDGDRVGIKRDAP